MTVIINRLDDLEQKVAGGVALAHDEAARVLATPDLISVGVLGEIARRHRAGETVTYGRVSVVVEDALPAERGEAGEVRIVGTPASVEQAVGWVRATRVFAGDVLLTGFSLADLLGLAANDTARLGALCRDLAAAGLEAVAATPVDRAVSTEVLGAAVQAARLAGLGVWRLTVDRASLDERLALVERAAAVGALVGDVRAFAPLPRLDPADVPSTGYDDVRTVTVASLVCTAIPFIQVDWPLYGPKLAQVSLMYGANDLDGVAAADSLQLGPRRAPLEDMTRQIRSAGAIPAERSGRYELST
jgi:hypothetical protein